LRYLLDTNICIYALKNRPSEVLLRLQDLDPAKVVLSVITVLELRQGAYGSQNPELAHQRLERFFLPLRILPFEEGDSFAGAKLRAELSRQGRPIGDMDSLIAAQALTRDLVLVSNNLREFSRVPDLRTENWVEPNAG
jgi:tRNA(fMet)-specific endonuclease VapC